MAWFIVETYGGDFGSRVERIVTGPCGSRYEAWDEAPAAPTGAWSFISIEAPSEEEAIRSAMEEIGEEA